MKVIYGNAYDISDSTERIRAVFKVTDTSDSTTAGVVVGAVAAAAAVVGAAALQRTT